MDDTSAAVAYFKGAFVPRGEARVDVEDRGFVFADAVYEVVRLYRGRAFLGAEHGERLANSLRAIGMEPVAEAARLSELSEELCRRNGMAEARVYWQVSRGCAPRSHVIPAGLTPTVFALAARENVLPRDARPAVLRAITALDERWGNCSIKTVMLLPNILARSAAAKQGAYEAILHREGKVTEGAATTVFMVREGEVWTHPADRRILGSITRRCVLDLARQAGIVCHEQAFTVEELRGADEAFLAGTTTHVSALGAIDDQPLALPAPGPLTTRLFSLLVEHIWRVCP